MGEKFDIPLVAAIAAVPLLLWLGVPAVYWWDEARVAINALEMMQSPGLVSTFHHQPDIWNTKPPLAVWLSALSMWLFGVNEFALRLPSALAAIGTTVAVFAFTRRIADRRTAYLAALMLLGMGGFVATHVARTADFDSLLVLFTTLTTFSLYFAFDKQRFAVPAAYFGGGLMTKGPAILMMAPGYILYALIYRIPLRRAVVPGLVVAGLVAAFFVARELANPGYSAAAWTQDFVRFGQPADAHSGGPLFYFTGLFQPWQGMLLYPMHELPYVKSAFPWSWVALLAILRPQRPVIYLACCLGGFVLMLSIAATKLHWYVAPAYPLIAVLAAVGVQRLSERLGRHTYPAMLLVAILCIGANLWELHKEMGTLYTSVEQRQPNLMKRCLPSKTEFAGKTPTATGMETYLGPAEFYLLRDRLGQSDCARRNPS